MQNKIIYIHNYKKISQESRYLKLKLTSFLNAFLKSSPEIYCLAACGVSFFQVALRHHDELDQLVIAIL